MAYFFAMIIREDVIDRYAEIAAARHERRVQDIIAITDQEVMDRIGAVEPDVVETDVLYSHFHSRRDSFYSLTGFTIDEFDMLWLHVEEKFSSSGRGRKSKISPKDILILLLHYIRRYPRVEEQSSIFSLRPSTIQNILTKYIPIIAQVLKKTSSTLLQEKNQFMRRTSQIVHTSLMLQYKKSTSHS